MTIYHGISLILLSFIILAVGMIKPKWILLWMDNPSRMIIAAISMVVFMIGAVLYGEGNKEKQKLLKEKPAIEAVKPITDTPKPDVKPSKPVVAPPPSQAPSTSANDLRP